MKIDNIDRRFAGSLGYAKVSQNNENKDIAMGLLAKSAVLKVGTLLYYPFLERYNMYSLPSSPDWQPKNLAGNWTGMIENYDWTSAKDDIRQIVVLDQFEAKSGDSSVYRGDWTVQTSTHLIGYQFMTPELARLMHSFAPEQSIVHLRKTESVFKKWYAVFTEAIVGMEHNMNHPIDSYQLFMAKAWLEKDTVQPEELARYASTPWLEVGDLFYINKLAEVVKAYKGWCWSIDGTTCDDGSIPSTTGDLNGDLTVNIQDIIILINEIFTPSGVGESDINNDGKVDILDVISLINIIFS